MTTRRFTSRTLKRQVFTLFCLLWIPLSPSWGETVRVTLLQLNDVYQMNPVDKGRRGGLARVATLVKKTRETSPNTVMILAGDTLSPSIASKILAGKQMVEAWNSLGLDYAALGNHEFDFGPDTLRQRVGESRFPWLAANVVDKKTGKLFTGAPRYIIREFDGVKVGFFGLLTPDTQKASSPGPDVTFLDPVRTAAKLVPEMRKLGARVIVAITHLEMSEDKALARAVPVDVILGGHEHTLLQSLAGRTPIFKMGSDARNLGKIALNVDKETGKLESMDWEVVPVTSEIAEDPAMAKLNAEVERQLDARLGDVVGQTTEPLDAQQSTNRSRETNFGNWIADVYRAATQADIALVNGGSVRSNTLYPAGPITRRDILSILPFENPVLKLEVSGATIRAALEHGVSRLADAEFGGFPQVSGLRFRYDGKRPVGSRITEVTVGDAPLRDDKTYTLATSEFVRNGGDGYAMLKSAQLLIDPEEARLEPELVLGALRPDVAISPKTEGRIVRLDAEDEAP